MYGSSFALILVLILPSVWTVSLVDHEIVCRCGFQIESKLNRIQMVDNIIEDDHVADFCDASGEDKCAQFCGKEVIILLKCFFLNLLIFKCFHQFFLHN